MKRVKNKTILNSRGGLAQHAPDLKALCAIYVARNPPSISGGLRATSTTRKVLSSMQCCANPPYRIANNGKNFMVKLKDSSPKTTTDINLEAWLQSFATKLPLNDISLIQQACVLGQLAGEDQPTPSGESCLSQGLAMAEILSDLHLDIESIAAAIVYSSVHYSDLSIDDVKDHLGPQVAKLVAGVSQLDVIRSLQVNQEYNRTHIENIRKMLLAMAEDIRVVFIKLTERTCIMRAASVLSPAKQTELAKETMEIYAPLANRLGIGQLKWELEDLAFRYLEPEPYKKLASLVEERRIDREKYVENVITILTAELHQIGLMNFDISGRVKHIYSIYRKMVRKDVDYSQIYDIRAIRVLVNSIEECYTTLSIVHTLWEQIPQEFDDYIAHPKENGYRSLHTVVIGPHHKHIEIQIRTFEMHQEAELGVAAHWIYKEGPLKKAGYENKIAWLRQLLEWQKDLTLQEKSEIAQAEIFGDRVYVFTPTGDIIDLPTEATPLDFAYHIHSEVGHRCRGAKVNGNIVPLTYKLQTGERVEILTTRDANPSRDWLNPHLGYLKSPRARAKVHHWFKQLDYGRNLADGQAILDKELRRLELRSIDTEKIAQQLNFKTAKDMLAALGCGDIRLSQILNVQESFEAAEKKSEPELLIPVQRSITEEHPATGINIQGVGNLLTHLARCCQPVPGDAIIGFITQGRGVSIHRNDCLNVLQLNQFSKERLIEVQWGQETQTFYPATIYITAYDRQGLLRDITTVLTNEKINLIAANTDTDKNENIAHISLTLEISSLSSLSKVLDRIQQLTNIISAKRRK